MGGGLCRKYRELAPLVEWRVSSSRQRSRGEGIRRSRRVRLCGREAAASARLFRATPGEIRGRCARHALYHWTGFWSFDHEYLLQEPLDPWNIFFSSTYTLLLVLGLCRLWSNNREIALLFTLMLLLFPSVYYLTHPEMSYRLPIDAAAGIILVSYWLTSRFTSKRGNTEQANVPTQGEVTQ